jgi:hypothetical protein
MAVEQPSKATLRRVSLCRRTWWDGTASAVAITENLIAAGERDGTLFSAERLAQHRLDLEGALGETGCHETSEGDDLKQGNAASANKSEGKKIAHGRIDVGAREAGDARNVGKKAAGHAGVALAGKRLQGTDYGHGLRSEKSARGVASHRHTLACYGPQPHRELPQLRTLPRAQGDGTH